MRKPPPGFLFFRSNRDDDLAVGVIALQQAMGLDDLFKAEHARGSGEIVARFHAIDDGLQRHVVDRKSRHAEYKTAEEAEVDSARHLAERIEVGDRRAAAEKPGETNP